MDPTFPEASRGDPLDIYVATREVPRQLASRRLPAEVRAIVLHRHLGLSQRARDTVFWARIHVSADNLRDDRALRARDQWHIAFLRAILPAINQRPYDPYTTHSQMGDIDDLRTRYAPGSSALQRTFGSFPPDGRYTFQLATVVLARLVPELTEVQMYHPVCISYVLPDAMRDACSLPCVADTSSRLPCTTSPWEN